jgi:hypothetical protein
MFDNFFGNSFGFGGRLMKLVLKNPLALVVYSFLSKWYLIIALSSVIVVYWVYSGLKDAGVIDKAESIITKALEESKSVAQNCVPIITDISAFWQCVSNPPVYRKFNKEDLEKIKAQAMPANQTGDNELDELINPYQDNEHHE